MVSFLHGQSDIQLFFAAATRQFEYDVPSIADCVLWINPLMEILKAN